MDVALDKLSDKLRLSDSVFTILNVEIDRFNPESVVAKVSPSVLSYLNNETETLKDSVGVND